jgi:hypothetical protein
VRENLLTVRLIKSTNFHQLTAAAFSGQREVTSSDGDVLWGAERDPSMYASSNMSNTSLFSKSSNASMRSANLSGLGLNGTNGDASIDGSSNFSLPFSNASSTHMAVGKPSVYFDILFSFADLPQMNQILTLVLCSTRLLHPAVRYFL